MVGYSQGTSMIITCVYVMCVFVYVFLFKICPEKNLLNKLGWLFPT